MRALTLLLLCLNGWSVDLDSWLASFSTKKVSILYSGQILENPASSFGHLLLKFSDSENTSLRDQVIEFSADVPKDENNFVFFFKGILGGYKSSFKKIPYFLKINEYSHYENRDLWEYDLNLSEHETIKLLENIWHYQQGERDKYYFFTKNCAEALVRFLYQIKGVKKNREFTFYYSPLQAISDLKQNNLIGKVKFRPSLIRNMKRKMRSFSKQDHKDFDRITTLSDVYNKSFRSLDLALDKIKFDAIKSQRKADRVLYASLLKAKTEAIREHLPVVERLKDPSLYFKPLFLALGSRLDEGTRLAKFRPGVHELIDLQEKNLFDYSFNILEITAAYERSVKLRKILFFDLASYQNIHDLERSLSWDSALQVEKEDKYFWSFSTSVGYSYKNIFLGVTQESSLKNNKMFFKPGAKLSHIHQYKDMIKNLFVYRPLYDVRDKEIINSISNRTRFYLSDRFALETGLNYLDQTKDFQSEVFLLTYF